MNNNYQHDCKILFTSKREFAMQSLTLTPLYDAPRREIGKPLMQSLITSRELLQYFQ